MRSIEVADQLQIPLDESKRTLLSLILFGYLDPTNTGLPSQFGQVFGGVTVQLFQRKGEGTSDLLMSDARCFTNSTRRDESITVSTSSHF
jgi:hypothetical protein